MSEGHVYLCKWSKRKDGYKVWLEKLPRLNAFGNSLAEALDELSSVVCLATGDGEATFDLLAPKDKTDRNGLVTLSYNASWSPPAGFSRTDFAELYQGGMCRSCCSGIGPRTDKPLPVYRLGDGDLLGSRLRLPAVLLASDRFRQTLGKTEQNSLTWRPIQMCGKSRQTFFELGATSAIKTVADRTRRVSGWECPHCRRRLFGVSGDYDHTFIAAADIPQPMPKLLVIDDTHFLRIAIPLSRWRSIRGKPGAKSILTQTVVPLPEKRVLRRPVLRLLTESSVQAINREFDYSAGVARASEP